MVFSETGDSLIDLWEQQMASGQAPDLNAAFSPEELARIQQKLRMSKAARSHAVGKS